MVCTYLAELGEENPHALWSFGGGLDMVSRISIQS